MARIADPQKREEIAELLAWPEDAAAMRARREQAEVKAEVDHTRRAMAHYGIQVPDLVIVDQP